MKFYISFTLLLIILIGSVQNTILGKTTDTKGIHIINAAIYLDEIHDGIYSFTTQETGLQFLLKHIKNSK